MNLKAILEDEVMSEIGDVNTTELGTDQTSTKINDAMQIADRVIKLEQIEIDKQKLEIEYKKLDIEQQKADDEKLSRKHDRRIKVGDIATGLVVTGIGYFLAIGFEREHTITSDFGKKVNDKVINYFWKRRT